MVTYTRSVSTDFGGNIDILQFTDIVYASAIATNFTGGQTFGDVVELFFSVALTAPEIVILNGLISAYVYNSNYYPYDAVQEIQTIGNGQSLIDYQYGPNVMMYNINAGPTNLTSVTKSANTILIDGSGSLVNTSFYTTSNVKNIFPNSVVLTTGNGLQINSNGMLTSDSGYFGSIYSILEGTNVMNSTQINKLALSLRANSLALGRYRAGWACNFTSTSNNKTVEISVVANQITNMYSNVIGLIRQVPTDTDDFNNFSSFKQIELSGNIAIEMYVRFVDPGIGNATIIEPKIELWRVA